MRHTAAPDSLVNAPVMFEARWLWDLSRLKPGRLYCFWPRHLLFLALAAFDSRGTVTGCALYHLFEGQVVLLGICWLTCYGATAVFRQRSDLARQCVCCLPARPFPGWGPGRWLDLTYAQIPPRVCTQQVCTPQVMMGHDSHM